MTMENEERNYKTHHIWIKKEHRMYAYFQEMTQNAKNMHNTTNFTYDKFTQDLRKTKNYNPYKREFSTRLIIHLIR